MSIGDVASVEVLPHAHVDIAVLALASSVHATSMFTLSVARVEVLLMRASMEAWRWRVIWLEGGERAKKKIGALR